jgi:hypothetical protein
MLTAFVDAEGIIDQELVSDKQIVNGEFHAEVTDHRFRQVGLGNFCTTMRRRNLRATSTRLWRNGPIDPTVLI